MITFDINQKRIPKQWRFSRQVLQYVTESFARAVPSATGKVHVHAVDEEEIKRMNRMYRAKDAITDVLSFPSGSAPIFGELGDVLICFPQAERQAQGDVPLELMDLLVHGVLHVLGYDHETPADAEAMFPLQDTIVHEVLTQNSL